MALPRIEKVFVLMLENRSFDHMLGFSNITGTDAMTGKPRTIDGLAPNQYYNNDPTGSQPNPVFANPGAAFALTRKDKIPGHEFEDVLEQLAGAGAAVDPVTGAYPKITNAGFISNYLAKAPARTKPLPVMQGFGPGQVPALEALAREFAVCDAWFSSIPGPTWPNRFFFHAASSSGMVESPANWSVMSSTLFLGYSFQHGTIFDLMDAARLPWCIYEGDEFPQAFAIRGMTNQWLFHDRFREFRRFASEVSNKDFEPRYIFIEPNYGRDILPPQNFVGGNSEHPLDDVRSGERLIKTVYDTIRQSPHWSSSLLLITYDEHGGFYDHVHPPASAVPPGDVPNAGWHQPPFDFRQYGARVPTVIVSPYTGRNLVDDTPYDHTSFLRTLQLLFDLPALTDRDRHAQPFTHLLSLPQPRGVGSSPKAPLRAMRKRAGQLPPARDHSDALTTPRTLSAKRVPPQPRLVPSSADNVQPLQPHHYDWLHVAFLRNLAIQQYERPRELALEELRREALRIRTVGEARAYMTATRKRVRDFRKRLVRRHGDRP